MLNFSVYVTDRSCRERSGAPTEYFHTYLDLTFNECLNQSGNIVSNFSFPDHTSVNYYVPESSTSQPTLSPEVARSFRKYYSYYEKR